MTISKKWYVKDLPYKTIPACEKAYKKLTQNIFDFEGLNAEELEKIKACVCLIFSSMRNDSESQIEKQLKKPDRIRAFYLYKENCSNPAVCDFLGAQNENIKSLSR